jgi:hypothetical protein
MLRPIGDRVLVRVQKKEVTKGGIFIPQKYQKNQMTVLVIAKGAGKFCNEITVGKKYWLEPMFVSKEDLKGFGCQGLDLDEYGDKNSEGCILVEAENISAEVEE